MPSLKKGGFFSPDKYVCAECNTEFVDYYNAESCETECLKYKPLKNIENQGIDIPINIRQLINEFLGTDCYDRDELIEKLGKTKQDYVVPILVEQLKAYKHSENVIVALGNIGSEKALDILVKIIEGKNGEHFDFNPNNNDEIQSGTWSEYVEKDGTKCYFPWSPAEDHKYAAMEILIKKKYGLDSIIKSVILRFNHYSSKRYIENLKNIESEANEKLSEYLLNKDKLKNMLKENYDAYGNAISTDKQFFLAEEHILKAIGATGGSKNPDIRSLTIRGIISTYYPLIGWSDLDLIRQFQTSEELLNALNKDEYVLQYFDKEKDSLYGHISHYFPPKKSDKELKTVIRTGIVKALGILRYGKSVNSIIKIMKNIETQAVDEKYKFMLIGTCAEAFTEIKRKGTLKALINAKEFCEKGYDAFSERYDALKHIHNALALLGEKDSVLKIVEQFKSDEEDSKIREIIEDIDTEVLGEVFEDLELYDDAENLYTKNGMLKKAAKMRRNKAAQGAPKVDQTVIHGDYVDDRDTLVKDSVINRSNVGGSSKMQELKELTEMKKEGLIDDDEFKQMKKEILGK